MNWIKVKSPLIGNDEIDLIQLKVESSNGQKVKSRVLKQYFVLLGLLFFIFFYFVNKCFFLIHDLHNILCILEVIYSIVLLINKKQIFFFKFLLIKQMFLYDMN